jgi:alpha-beta hydrolase superfamily lysophospholipase
MDLLLKEAKERYPLCSAVLYGHSMHRSLVVSYALGRFPNETKQCPYQTAVVTGPWICLAGLFQLPRSVFSVIRLRFHPRKITRDEDIINSYGKDDNVRQSTTLSHNRS